MATPGQMTATLNPADPEAYGVLDIGLLYPQPKAELCGGLGRWTLAAVTRSSREFSWPGQVMHVLASLWRRWGEGTNSVRERRYVASACAILLVGAWLQPASEREG